MSDSVNINTIDRRIAERLVALRGERDWSLKELAGRCGVSRASLSRLEKAEVSPTAATLGRICAAYGLTVSRLMATVEDEPVPVLRPDEQAVWKDPATGFERRNVSPPNRDLLAEVLDCRIPPGQRIEYPDAPRQGLEHHLIMLEGRLDVEIDGVGYALAAGDCLRYRLRGRSCFETGRRSGARYHLVVV